MKAGLTFLAIVSVILTNTFIYAADTDSLWSDNDYVAEIGSITNKLPARLRNRYGFQDIVFESSFNTVRKALDVKFGNLSILGSENKDYIWVRKLPLGDQTVDATFFFDHKKRFYAFRFKPGSYSADKFDTAVRNDGKFLTDLFIQKYGNPSKCFNPHFLSVKHGSDTYLCRWNDKDLEIYTSLGTYEFEYYAESYVGSVSMVKEYHQVMQNKNVKSIKKGATDF